MEQKNVLLHLSLIKKVGQVTALRLAKIIVAEKHPERWYTYNATQLQRFGVSAVAAQLIVAGLADTQLLHNELELLQKHAISWTTFYDQEYPEALKHIHIPPLILYWQGTPVWHTQKACAIVGARKADAYGKAAVESIVSELVQQDWVIVSGGAYGIDAYAHQATLSAHGKTIVVVGSGLLKPYPKEHQKLYERIIQAGGMVASTFALQDEATKWTFPERNRIIAGLSQACLVVQAAAKSGALITAKHALQEGRTVCAVPGPFYSPLSQGCHALLQEGAKLVTQAQDIIQEFEPVQQSCVTTTATFQVSSVVKTDEKVKNNHQKQLCPILQHCTKPISLTHLVEITNLSEENITDILFDAQLAGIVEQNFAGMWCLK